MQDKSCTFISECETRKDCDCSRKRQLCSRKQETIHNDVTFSSLFRDLDSGRLKACARMRAMFGEQEQGVYL